MNNGITTTSGFNMWNDPTLIKTEEVGESIELIYKQTANFCYTTYPATSPNPRVFKIIFSCKNGKWNKSEPIYGEIVPATDEYYEFENDIE